MSYTETLTQTYTIADIGKVIDCFAADLDMTAQSTGLLSREVVTRYASDVKLMAHYGYLQEVNIVLKDSAGIDVRAAKYEVATDATSLTASRPGNNMWPATPSGVLTVIVRYSPRWGGLSQAQQTTFRSELGLTWIDASTDLSFPSLTGSADRNYVSNGWGMTKSVYR
jgi:hypothetical protein